MVYKKDLICHFFFSPEIVRVSLTILRIPPSGHFINIPHNLIHMQIRITFYE